MCGWVRVCLGAGGDERKIGFVAFCHYRLVAKEHIQVRQELHQSVFEELADEGGGEVEAEQLVVF